MIKKYIIRNITKINNERYKNVVKNIIFKNTIYNVNSVIKDFPPKKEKKLNKNNQYIVFNYKNKKNTMSLSNKRLGLYSNNTKNNIYSLSYDLAFKCDKRNYFQYYLSLLKQKHLIIFTFCNNQDYNIFILKLSLFLSSFSLYFAVNALFFTDESMHTIYKANGNSGIISQITNIIYSTIISCFINIIIKKLGLSYNDMIKIKQIPNAIEELKQSTLLMKKLKIKFGIFFIIIFIFISFFWYFIAAFCAVYKNTQKILIENTLSSFALSLLYPFGINLIPGIFRIPSLINYSGCSKCCYFISKLIAFI